MILDQILVVNKPKGWTSHDVVQKIRRVLKIRRVGHAGTLDPMAKGVLLVLVGKGTKKQQRLMRLPKEYLAEITFGSETDTYDAEGQVLVEVEGTELRGISSEVVERALMYFRGQIFQKVPPYSAVKVKGKRLYKLARKGLVDEKDLPERKVTIYELELLSFVPYRRGWLLKKARLPKAGIRLVCSSGTYVRSIAHDMGRLLGVGGFVSEITRTKVGEYTLEQAKEIEEILE